jgi:hypothetical protein
MTPMVMRLQKHPTNKPKNGFIVVTKKSKSIVEGGPSQVKKGKCKKRLVEKRINIATTTRRATKKTNRGTNRS